MRHLYASSLSSFFPGMILAIGVCLTPVQGQVVKFTDANAEEAIRIALNNRMGDVMVSDLARVKELDLSSRDMREFSLPEGLVNLELLVLERNRLTEVNLPSNLDSIRSIELQRNDLVEWEIPEGLETLESLELWENELTTLKLPSDLSGLIKLDLFNNKLVEVELPDGLQHLEILDLRENRLEAVVVSHEIIDRFRSYFRDQLDLPLRADPAPEIREVRRTKGVLEFTILGLPGVTYEVFSSATANKDGVLWKSIGLFTTDESGRYRYRDTSALFHRQYFYRVVREFFCFGAGCSNPGLEP